MVATDSFMDFTQDILAFLKSNTLHEDDGGEALAQVVANEDETFVSPDDARWFSTFSFDMRKLEFPDEVDELGLPVFLDHHDLPDYGRGLRVSGLLILNLD